MWVNVCVSVLFFNFGDDWQCQTPWRVTYGADGREVAEGLEVYSLHKHLIYSPLSLLYQFSMLPISSKTLENYYYYYFFFTWPPKCPVKGPISAMFTVGWRDDVFLYANQQFRIALHSQRLKMSLDLSLKLGRNKYRGAVLVNTVKPETHANRHTRRFIHCCCGSKFKN